MTKAQYTPGPWETIGTFGVQSKNCFQVARTILAYPEFEETAEANALLIAAAPELLEALKNCLDALEYVEHAIPGKVGYGVRQDRIREAKAAIAKAEGLS